MRSSRCKTKTQSKASFSAVSAGTYTISLTVNDGKGYHKLSKDLTVVDSNHTPTISRIELSDSEVYPGESIYFTAYAEDQNSDPITYKWQVVSRPQNSKAELVNATLKQAHMVFDEIGEYVVEVSVSDGLSRSEAKRAHVKVIAKPATSPNNRPPFATLISIGSLASPNVPIKLSVDAQDPEGDALTYRWLILQAPQGASYSFSNTTEQEVELTVSKAGFYLVHVYAHDGQAESLYPAARLISVK